MGRAPAIMSSDDSRPLMAGMIRLARIRQVAHRVQRHASLNQARGKVMAQIMAPKASDLESHLGRCVAAVRHTP